MSKIIVLDLELIGNNIKVARGFKGYTQKQFSEVIGTSSPTLGCIERGETVPKLDVMVNIAAKTDKHIGWFIEKH